MVEELRFLGSGAGRDRASCLARSAPSQVGAGRGGQVDRSWLAFELVEILNAGHDCAASLPGWAAIHVDAWQGRWAVRSRLAGELVKLSLLGQTGLSFNSTCRLQYLEDICPRSSYAVRDRAPVLARSATIRWGLGETSR